MITYCSSATTRTWKSRRRDNLDGLGQNSSALGDETIVAVITPPGEGGIAALRLAGRHSLSFSKRHFVPEGKEGPLGSDPFRLRYGRFVDREGEMIDEVTAVFMPHGRSYTGEEQVEIFCHGGYQIVQGIQRVLIEAGARAAEPGEFTRLAFLNGRIDLARAEAVAEIIAANTEKSCAAAREHLSGAYSECVGSMRRRLVEILAEIEASIDFPEEGIEPDDSLRLAKSLDALGGDVQRLADSYRGGKIIREGFRIVIAGRPNAGKSSLFNILLRQERALVMDTPGTTRDYLSEWIELDGIAVNLIDTAGLRDGGEGLERAGQDRSKDLIATANMTLWLVDLAEEDWEAVLVEDLKTLQECNILLLGNKLDLVGSISTDSVAGQVGDLLAVSCLTGDGLQDLSKALISKLRQELPDLTSGVIVTSARHQQKLKLATEHLRLAGERLCDNESPELIAFELRQAMGAVDEITGRIYNEEILERVFSRFCVGK